MYGEDIDLSYRIIKAGYKNYYFPKTTIIHYKGESTKKGSLNYVRIFYQAMSIFAKKHYSKKNLNWFLIFIHLAIYLRAGASILKRLFQRILLPVMDFALIFFLFRNILPLWGNLKFENPNYYSSEIINVFIPSYILICLFFVLINNGYDKLINSKKLFFSVVYGSTAILIIYSLLPEYYRFSRVIILTGSMITFVSLYLNRIVTSLFKINNLNFIGKTKQKTVIIFEANKHDDKLIDYFQNKYNIIGYLSTKTHNKENYLGNISRLSEIIDFYKISRVIYFLEDISTTDIIKSMLSVSNKNMDFKIVLPAQSKKENNFLILDVGEHPENKMKLSIQTENKSRKNIFTIFKSLKKQ